MHKALLVGCAITLLPAAASRRTEVFGFVASPPPLPPIKAGHRTPSPPPPPPSVSPLSTLARHRSSSSSSSSNSNRNSRTVASETCGMMAASSSSSSAAAAAAADGIAKEEEADEFVFPRAPLPEIIVSNVPGTWAYDTMSRRLRENILMRIYDENDMDKPEMASAKAGLDALVEELKTAGTSKLRPIVEDGGPEVSEWNAIMEPYLGVSWLDTPWLYSEFYAYRRVMEAFSFFKTGKKGTLCVDPFMSQKMLGVTSALKSMEALAKRLLATDAEVLGSKRGIKLYTTAALWGNRMDLSIWPVEKGGENSAGSGDVFSQVLESSSENLLADDSDRLAEVLAAYGERGGERVDIVVDNAGFELFCDLCLADCLATGGTASRVVIQLKGHPTFVSDAMAKDMMAMIDLLADLGASEYPSAKAVGERWKELIADGKWELREDFFWAQPRPLWEMPSRIRRELGDESSMVFVKGDANYRRLIGDRLWETDTPFSDVAGYFPTRLCALRTLKAELGCGMAKEGTERAAREHDDWMVNGRYGCIQMFDPASD
ncbi:unnamed protein product [Pylaiella littoralis]